MAEASVPKITHEMGKESNYMERICYAWLNLYVGLYFSWIGS